MRGKGVAQALPPGGRPKPLITTKSTSTFHALPLVKDFVAGLRESADAFPPLKSVVGGVLYIWQLAEQVKSNRKQAEALAERAKELVTLVTDLMRLIDNPENMPPDMCLALELFASTLTEISTFMEQLSHQKGISRFLDRSKHQEQLSQYALRLSEVERDFQLCSIVRLEQRLYGLGRDISEHCAVGRDIHSQMTLMDRKIQTLSFLVVFLG